MKANNERNIWWHNSTITRKDRERLNGHKGVTIWLTGLSGSGKSTIAQKLEERLFEMGVHTFILDGDNIRFGLNKDLGFSRKDRDENIRRIGEVAKLFTNAGIINIIAFISPYISDRERAREIQPKGDFIEVYVKCPLYICETRDPKGLYKKARAGEIKNFTGINDPYEEPINPELVIDTANLNVENAVNQILDYLVEKNIISAKNEDK